MNLHSSTQPKSPAMREVVRTTPASCEFARSYRTIAFAALWLALAMGWAWVPTWSGPVSYASDAQAVTIDEKSRGFDVEAAIDEVIKVHNRLRAEAKLPPLEVSSKLQAAAQRHAKDMAAHGKMTHKGTDGSSAVKRILAKGYNYRRRRKRRGRKLHRRAIDEGLDGQPAP